MIQKKIDGVKQRLAREQGLQPNDEDDDCGNEEVVALKAEAAEMA